MRRSNAWMSTSLSCPATFTRAQYASLRRLAALSGDAARPLGVSLGLAVHDPARPETPDSLLARADGAMYRVKQRGKGSFAVAARAVATETVA